MAERAMSSITTPGSADPELVDPERVDPDNELLWRMRLRRLESEVIRDCILSISGKLIPAAGGPPIPIGIVISLSPACAIV